MRAGLPGVPNYFSTEKGLNGIFVRARALCRVGSSQDACRIKLDSTRGAVTQRLTISAYKWTLSGEDGEKLWEKRAAKGKEAKTSLGPPGLSGNDGRQQQSCEGPVFSLIPREAPYRLVSIIQATVLIFRP